MRDFYTKENMQGAAFHVPDAGLLFEPSELSFETETDTGREGTIRVRHRAGKPARGYVYPSERCMRGVREQFAPGADGTGFIRWQFDARGLAPGRQISGAFRVISPYGEYSIPYTVKITGKGEIVRADGDEPWAGGGIRAKADFLKLAERDFREAAALFYSSRFEKLLDTEADRTLYRGLSMQEGNLQNVEEFLIAACGKEKTVFEPVEKTLFLRMQGQAARAQGRMAGSRAERALEAYRQRVRNSGMGGGRSAGNGAPAKEDLVYLSLSIKKYGTGSLMPVIRAEGRFLPAAPLEVEKILERVEEGEGSPAREAAFAPQIPAQPVRKEDGSAPAQTAAGEPAAKTAAAQEGRGPEVPAAGAEEGVRIPEPGERGAAAFGAQPERKESAVFTVRIPVGRDTLHDGRNFGRVIIEGPFNDAEIPVEIHCRSAVSMHHRRIDRELERLQLQLMRMYVAFRIGKKNPEGWFVNANRLIDEISVRSRRDLVPRLYGVHLLLLRGQNAEAARELGRIAVRNAGTEGTQNFSARFTGETEDAYCYRQYLGARCHMEDVMQRTRVCRFLRGVYRQTGDWRTAWMLMDLSEEYAPGTGARWHFLRNQFENGCISPVIFLEAWEMVRQDPQILLPGSSVQERWSKDDFALHVLWYAARNNVLTPMTARAMVSLAEKKKSFSPLLYKALCAAYQICDFKEADPGEEEPAPEGVREKAAGQSASGAEETAPRVRQIKKELLRAVCILLMRGHDLSAEAHKWYARSVEEGVLLTRLEENLRLSAPVQDSEFRLPAGCNAVLRTTAQRAVRAVVRYDHFRNEQVFPIRNGVCFLSVFGDANTVFLEDEKGSRYAASLPYILDLKRTAKEDGGPARARTPSEAADVENAYELAERIGFGRRGSAVLSDSLSWVYEAAGRLLDSGLLTSPARTELLLLCLNDCENALSDPELSKLRRFFLAKADPTQCTQAERAVFIEYFLMAEDYEKALLWILSHGTAGIRSELLGMVCLGFSWENCALRTQAAVVALGWEAFLRGNHEPSLLKNLALYFQGTAQELIMLRSAFLDAGLSTTELDRRIVRQALYTGKVLQTHAQIIVSAGRKLEGAFLPAVSQFADYSFSEGLAMGYRMTDLIAGLITQEGAAREEVPDICMIACLKELSMRHGEISGREKSAAAASLTALLSKGIIFPFYRQFPGLDDRLDLYAEETLVQYHPPLPEEEKERGRQIVFHYAGSRRGETGNFRSRPMKEMYRGFYVSGFRLFYGEQMRYYITDDKAEKHVVQSGVIGQDARILNNCSGRFGLINEVTRAAALREYDEALSLLTGYYRKSYLESELFRR